MSTVAEPRAVLSSKAFQSVMFVAELLASLLAGVCSLPIEGGTLRAVFHVQAPDKSAFGPSKGPIAQPIDFEAGHAAA